LMPQQRIRTEGRNELELIDEWYAYNSFVRKKYLRLFERLPEAELLRDRGASFPSLLDIFAHVIDSYRWWFLYICRDRVHEWKGIKGSGLGLREIAREEHKIDANVRKFLHGLSLRDLERPIIYHKTTRSGKRKREAEYGGKIRDMLWHKVEEELQHRGELNALLWQMNIDPPITAWEPEEPGWIRFKAKYHAGSKR
jgi:uncharacterized damage-inducible protein DinB